VRGRADNREAQSVTIHPEIRKHIEVGSNLFTDAWASYKGLESEYAHQVIDQSIIGGEMIELMTIPIKG